MLKHINKFYSIRGKFTPENLQQSVHFIMIFMDDQIEERAENKGKKFPPQSNNNSVIKYRLDKKFDGNTGRNIQREMFQLDGFVTEGCLNLSKGRESQQK